MASCFLLFDFLVSSALSMTTSLGVPWRSFQIPRGWVLGSLHSCMLRKGEGFECPVLELRRFLASKLAVVMHPARGSAE